MVIWSQKVRDYNFAASWASYLRPFFCFVLVIFEFYITSVVESNNALMYLCTSKVNIVNVLATVWANGHSYYLHTELILENCLLLDKSKAVFLGKLDHLIQL